MARITFFKNCQTTKQYHPDAINTYIASQLKYIRDAADFLGMPVITTAIAGAMAEENDPYCTNYVYQYLIDKYALSNLNASDIPELILSGNEAVVLGEILFDTVTYRSHAEWSALYLKAQNDFFSTNVSTPGKVDKLCNPVLIDLGKANIQLYTAIRLLQDPALQAEVATLGLTEYQDQYDILAQRLVDDNIGLSAKIYALLIKEGDNWYQAHDAYGEDWDSLPREIKDALYITYTNFGKEVMEKKYNDATCNGTLPYEPLPGAEAGGGLNHLANAAGIGGVLGIADYGVVDFADTLIDWPRLARENSDQGAAYREALVKLRPFVVEDGNYISEVQNADDFSERYLQDRATMLSWLTELKYDGAKPDATYTYHTIYADHAQLFEDLATGMHIELGSGNFSKIIFGTGEGESLTGDSAADHLYGMAGDDTLTGNDGDDYLEGGKGQDTLDGGDKDDTLVGGADDDTLIGGAGHDTYVWRAGDGNDTIIETRENGTLDGIIKLVDANGQALFAAGGFQETAPDSNVWEMTMADGSILTLTHHSPWTLTMADGSSLQLGENQDDFQDGDFGIKLLEKPEEPEVTGLTLYGDQGEPGQADEIDGGGAGDLIYGYGGHDIIWGHQGDDIIYGGDDADDLMGDKGLSSTTVFGDDYLDGEGGDDGLTGEGGSDVLLGGAGNDILQGDDAPNHQLDGQYHGKDYLDGGAGDDTLWGHGDDDILLGGDGADALVGDDDSAHPMLGPSYGADYLDGGADDDVLRGGGKNDILLGGDGNDNLQGDYTEGATLAGQYHGADYLDGGEGDDTLLGDGGDDVLLGGLGSDELVGDTAANEPLEGQYHGSDYLDGGADDDKLWGGGNGDTLLGGDGNDTLQGDFNGSQPEGQYHGADFLDGGAGADKLIGDGGDDVLLGGAGQDELVGDNGGDQPLDGQYHGVDYLDGGADDDKLLGGGNDDTLLGGEGSDYLQGDLNGDTPTGDFHGIDFLDGGAGDDTLLGDGGADTLLGGDGNDMMAGDNNSTHPLDGQYHGADFLDGGAGDDSMFGDGGTDTLLGGEGNDKLAGDNASDQPLDGSYQAADYLDGGDGDDQLIGGGGADTLLGGEGNDVLVGDNASNQTLEGQYHGADFLIGGAGTDYLVGGEGDDSYLLELGDSPLDANNQRERIIDDGGVDTIVFGAGIQADDLGVNVSNMVDMLVHYSGDDRLSIAGGFIGQVESFQFADGLTLGWQQVIGRYYDAVVNLNMAGAGAVLVGGNQNDALHAADGGATFSGGRGDDTLGVSPGYTSQGNNTYVYHLGDGADTISDTGGRLDGQGNLKANVVRFGTGITSADLKLDLGSLLIHVGSAAGDSIRITNFNPNDVFSQRAIDRFEFADGSSLTYDELLARGFDINGSDAGETLTGTNIQDRINGGAGVLRAWINQITTADYLLAAA